MTSVKVPDSQSLCKTEHVTSTESASETKRVNPELKDVIEEEWDEYELAHMKEFDQYDLLDPELEQMSHIPKSLWGKVKNVCRRVKDVFTFKRKVQVLGKNTTATKTRPIIDSSKTFNRQNSCQKHQGKTKCVCTTNNGGRKCEIPAHPQNINIVHKKLGSQVTQQTLK